MFGTVKSVVLSGQVLPIHRTEIILTTSRDAPVRVRTFLNELTFLFPNSAKINRGKQNVKDLLKNAIYFKSKYLIIIDVIKGNPGRLRVYDLITRTLKYKFIIKGVTLLTELKLPRTIISRGCLGHIDNLEVKNFLIDLGYIYIDNCDAYAIGNYIYQNNTKIFELKFVKEDKLLGPIIRFLIDDGNKNQIRSWG